MDIHGFEILKVLIVGIVGLCIWLGRTEIRSRGWSYIFAGFLLIFSVETIKVIDEFSGLRDFFISEIEHKATPEKIYVLGFFLLAVGVYKWLPRDRKSLEETIKYMAYYDTLTKLPNRMLFTERLQQALCRGAQEQQALLRSCFWTWTASRSSTIPTTITPETFCLSSLPSVCKALCRDCDTVARLGGDEFILLFPALKSAQDARVLAQKILKVFAAVFSTGQL